MPVPLASKAPVIKEWQTLRVNAQTAAKHFNGKPQNVGVILGEVSGHLVDVDLDCGEAIALANDFLPFTASIFGRDSKPRSHWLYVARGATFAKFIDPQQGDTLLELRAGSGKQTVFPGSTHVSAEAVRWDIDGDVSEVARDDLETAVRTLAAAVLLARYWRAGDYHGTTLPLVGGMLRAGAPAVWLSKVLKAVGKAAGRQDLQDIDDAIKSTAAKLADGQPVQGWPTLKEHMPPAVVDRVTQWLGLSQDAETAKPDPLQPPAFHDLRLSEDELNAAQLAPRCFIKDYLYADVATLIAPGGTGKTTLQIYEAVCFAIGRPVHGLKVESVGWVLFVSAEDRREQLVARLREIMRAMDLSPSERATVLDRIRIWDVTGQQVKLIECDGGNIVLSALADNIIEAYKADPPAICVFDPLVSFGASEGMVNDNEQALVTAARRIVRALDCCVRLVTHTGKSNAREKTFDPYSNRGGSALPDGARMVAVMHSWDANDPGKLRPPPACAVTKDASITVMARPKLSYAPPNLPFIWIRRTGHTFESFTDFQVSEEQKKSANADQVLRFVESQLKQDRKHSGRSLETSIPNMSRADFRAALNELVVSNRITERDLPAADRKGQRKTYLVPAQYGALEAFSEINAPDDYQSNCAAPLREEKTAQLNAPVSSLVPERAKNQMAQYGAIGALDPMEDMEP